MRVTIANNRNFWTTTKKKILVMFDHVGGFAHCLYFNFKIFFADVHTIDTYYQHFLLVNIVFMLFVVIIIKLINFLILSTKKKGGGDFFSSLVPILVVYLLLCVFTIIFFSKWQLRDLWPITLWRCLTLVNTPVFPLV